MVDRLIQNFPSQPFARQLYRPAAREHCPKHLDRAADRVDLSSLRDSYRRG